MNGRHTVWHLHSPSSWDKLAEIHMAGICIQPLLWVALKD